LEIEKMAIETKIKNFIDYAREVCLQSLLLADNIKVDLKSQDNLYEVERIDNEIISKYENIYLLLDETTLLDIYKKDAKVFEKIEETIKKMAEDNRIKDEYIKLEQALKLTGEVSMGSEAKYLIKDGKVSVNGEVELRRGRKLRNSDIFNYNNHDYKIIGT